MMATVVMKFGGASVASVEQFAKLALIIEDRLKEFPKIVVVVSAMGSTTDELLKLAHSVHPNPPKREQDMLITTGERISIALLAMALDLRGIKAISFTGSQSGIITSSEHSDARILEVRPERIEKALEQGRVAIVAGFQGVSREKEITTLGRGGSDTSAVAMAIALKAERVEFYKDVPGIGKEDPFLNPETEIYELISYEEMLAMGAEVLHPRCIELAQTHQLQLQIRCFNSHEIVGTIIGKEVAYLQ